MGIFVWATDSEINGKVKGFAVPPSSTSLNITGITDSITESS